MSNTLYQISMNSKKNSNWRELTPKTIFANRIGVMVYLSCQRTIIDPSLNMNSVESLEQIVNISYV